MDIIYTYSVIVLLSLLVIIGVIGIVVLLVALSRGVYYIWNENITFVDFWDFTIGSGRKEFLDSVEESAKSVRQPFKWIYTWLLIGFVWIFIAVIYLLSLKWIKDIIIKG